MKTYTLAECAEMLKFPKEALLGVEYADDRITGHQYDSGNVDDDPQPVPSAWRLLRDAIKAGKPSVYHIRVYLRSVSRDIDGYAVV